MKYIDMHIHTIYSDGEDNLEEIINHLKEENIKLFSFTDHDNIESCYKMEKLNTQDMTYIPGVEFSTIKDNIKCHILGYNIDYYDDNIIRECEIIRNNRYERMLELVDQLHLKFNILIPENVLEEILTKKGTIGKPQIMKYLKNEGYGTAPEIFNLYLKQIKAEKEYRRETQHIINIIKRAGGKAILAHPLQIEERYNIDINDFIEEFIELGIDGIEVYNNIHSAEDIIRYKEVVEKYNLLYTGGSDYHGINIKPNVELGKVSQEKIMIEKIVF